MITDIDLRHYYAKFQEEAKDAKEKIKSEYDLLIKIKEKQKNKLYSNKNLLNVKYDINLDNYPELDNNIVPKELFNKFKAAFNSREVSESNKLYVLSNYLITLKKLYALEKKLDLIDKRANVSYTEYRQYVYGYYRYGVHKCLLEGYSYSLADNSIEIVISRNKLDRKNKNGRPYKEIIDFNETNKKKRELLEKGLIPYNKEDAEIAKLRGIKYEGVPYVVYKRDDFKYDIEVIIRKGAKNKNIIFKRLERIHNSLRGMTREEIAAKCNSVEDIYNLKCDINHKLGILLKYDNTAYLNFIRNAEQNKYSIGNHNSKNRQRF